MKGEWFRRVFGAAASEIRLMRMEREWAGLDGLVRDIESKIDRLNAYHANQYADVQLHWERGRLVWEGRDAGRADPSPSPAHDLER